jgi:hypothetical protein
MDGGEANFVCDNSCGNRCGVYAYAVEGTAKDRFKPVKRRVAK